MEGVPVVPPTVFPVQLIHPEAEIPVKEQDPVLVSVIFLTRLSSTVFTWPLPIVREIPVNCEPSELLIAHAHYDHTDADEDINCVFPLARLWELEVEGYIGECAPVHYSLMGYVPEVRRIVRAAADHVIPGLRTQEVDVVVVSGGCVRGAISAAYSPHVASRPTRT